MSILKPTNILNKLSVQIPAAAIREHMRLVPVRITNKIKYTFANTMNSQMLETWCSKKAYMKAAALTYHHLNGTFTTCSLKKSVAQKYPHVPEIRDIFLHFLGSTKDICLFQFWFRLHCIYTVTLKLIKRPDNEVWGSRLIISTLLIFLVGFH